ncbi:MAG TPA: PilZ domain-containing protein [Pyrinomonadaceae bacterium]|jgi:hypothetical protein
MSTERRASKRVQTNLHARWEGILARYDGTITDLGVNGCFILTTDNVRLQELVRLELELPKKGWIYLWAEVVYVAPEMGFALRFTGLSDAEEELLVDYINDL